MIDLCSSPEPDEAEAGPSSRPGKRKAVDIGGDDVILASPPHVAGPSKRPRGNDKPAQVDEDIAVLNDRTTNPNRDLPHRRETCATYPFHQVASRENSLYCDKCFCVVCDKPASECTQWGDGLSPAHHCNAKAATCKKPAQPAVAAPRALAGSSAGWPGMHHSPSPSPSLSDDPDNPYRGLSGYPYGYPEYDSDEENCGVCGAPYDYDGECAECGHMRDDDCDGFGYGGFGHVLHGIPRFGMGPPVPQKRNPWLFGNEDAHHYQMTKDTKDLAHHHKPIKRKRIPVKVSDQVRKDASKLGTIHFPVEVSAAAFKKIQAQLAAAPYGYQDDFRAASLTDWRSWQALLDQKWSLAAVIYHQKRAASIPVYVTQAFDAVKEDKKVKLPQLPTETIKLLPVEGIQGPEEPPVKTTLRACLLIDCTSPQKPQFVGVHTTSGTTMKDVKRSVAEIIGKKLDDKTSALGDGTMLLCGESHVRSVRPTFHRDESRFEEPTSFMQLSKDSTSLHKENLKNQMNDRHISAAWYVQIPIMVPMWKTADGGAVSTLKSNGLDALASKVTAVLRRWGVLENVAPHRLSHLKEQFFCAHHTPSCTLSEFNGLWGSFMPLDTISRNDRLQHDMNRHQMMLQKLPTLSVKELGYVPDPAVHNPHALVATLVLDKLNLKLDINGFFKTDVKAPLRQDLLVQDLMAPKLHASVSEDELKLHREYVDRRRRIVEHGRKVKTLSTKAMHEIVRNTTSAVPAVRPGFTHTKLVDQGGGKHALCVEIYLTKEGKALSNLELFPKPPPAGRGRRRFIHDDIDHTHPMQSCLEIILSSNKEWKAMDEQLNQGNRHMGLSLGNVMSKIEASPNLPSMIQPVGLHDITLHEYQKQSLKWMIDMENTPLRSKLWVPVNAESDVWYSPSLHKLSKGVPEGPRGGILAEEMGLGKTVEILSLVLAMPASPNVVNGAQWQTPTGKLVQSRGTLVVCKVSLVGQWVTEAKSKLADKSLKIVEYHGPNRIRNLKQLAEHDIVVTTYETLSSDSLGRTKKCSGDKDPVPRIHWHRLVLDESHAIKDQSTKSFQAIDAIKSTCRWACTGTPINTDVKDLSGQFAALHMQPLGTKSFQQGMLSRGFFELERELLLIMRTLIMRHSKKSVQEGGAWSLPTKTDEMVPVNFTKTEWQTYKTSYDSVQRAFSMYENGGPACCNKHVIAIMALLAPLRRLCSGGRHSLSSITVAAPDLNAPEAAGNAGAANPNLPAYPRADDMECAICFETYEIPVRTNCGHWFCKECIKDALAMNQHCPLCRAPAQQSQLTEAVFPANEPEAEPEAEAEASTSRRGTATHVEMNSKMNELVKQLRQMHASDASNKALIFTQYNSTLDFVAKQLHENGFTCRCISGKMPMKQRAAAIEAFQSDPPTTVFVLSVRAAAVGITLTSANYIFMVEPLLNTALDDQAVGRAWRMGQKRPVTVKRLYIKGSVEEAIMQVAKDRQGSGYVPTTARQKQNVGALTADKAALRLEEMRTLFAAPKPPTGVWSS